MTLFCTRVFALFSLSHEVWFLIFNIHFISFWCHSNKCFNQFLPFWTLFVDAQAKAFSSADDERLLNGNNNSQCCFSFTIFAIFLSARSLLPSTFIAGEEQGEKTKPFASWIANSFCFYDRAQQSNNKQCNIFQTENESLAASFLLESDCIRVRAPVQRNFDVFFCWCSDCFATTATKLSSA